MVAVPPVHDWELEFLDWQQRYGGELVHGASGCETEHVFWCWNCDRWCCQCVGGDDDPELCADCWCATQSAVLSPCGTYRYRLRRELDEQIDGHALWVMANPSTADAEKDDATIRKVRGFTKLFGCGSFTVVNLYAFRSTKPAALIQARDSGADVVGPKNDRHIQAAGRSASLVVVAWGDCFSGSHFERRKSEVRLALRHAMLTRPEDQFLRCLGRTASGNPRHPLMLPYGTPLEVY